MELRTDPNNRNLSSVRGEYHLRESFDEFGACRGVGASNDGVILAGNHSFDMAAEKGMRIKEVRTRGDQLIAVRRKDLDLEEGSARKYAIVDDRTQETGLVWDKVGIIQDYQRGVRFGLSFREEDLVPMVQSIKRRLDAVAKQEREDVQPGEKVPGDRKIRIYGPKKVIDRFNRMMEATAGINPADKLATVLSEVAYVSTP